jgi:hypothetical protein
VESFKSDRKEKIKVHGMMGEEKDVETEEMQRSPTSLILFAILIAGLIMKVEKEALEVTTLSFVDDITWVVDGKNVNQCASYMQRCARCNMQWVEVNTVQLNIAKTEVVLFSKTRNH